MQDNILLSTGQLISCLEMENKIIHISRMATIYGQNTCPNLPKDTLGAQKLTEQARELLEDGKTELAKATFAQARELDANVVFGDEGLK